jgi:hypothetical protein
VQIIIVGRECPECDQLHTNVCKALELLGWEDRASFEHVDDIREQLELFGVEKVPALVVDGTLVSEGDIPTPEELVRMLEDREWIA